MQTSKLAMVKLYQVFLFLGCHLWGREAAPVNKDLKWALKVTGSRRDELPRVAQAAGHCSMSCGSRRLHRFTQSRASSVRGENQSSTIALIISLVLRWSASPSLRHRAWLCSSRAPGGLAGWCLSITPALSWHFSE